MRIYPDGTRPTARPIANDRNIFPINGGRRPAHIIRPPAPDEIAGYMQSRIKGRWNRAQIRRGIQAAQGRELDTAGRSITAPEFRAANLRRPRGSSCPECCGRTRSTRHNARSQGSRRHATQGRRQKHTGTRTCSRIPSAYRPIRNATLTRPQFRIVTAANHQRIGGHHR